jgi:[ribosomal protein S5]-alanine N-acetyltransferase
LDTYLRWLNDADIIKHLTTPRLFKQNAETVRAYIRSHDGIDSFLFGIFHNDGVHIGNAAVRISRLHQRATIGYMIGDKEYWGRNVVNPTRARILDFLFLEQGVNRVHGGCFTQNVPTLFNYKKQGWTSEGELRQHDFIEGEFVSTHLFSMLADEWVKIRDIR